MEKTKFDGVVSAYLKKVESMDTNFHEWDVPFMWRVCCDSAEAIIYHYRRYCAGPDLPKNPPTGEVEREPYVGVTVLTTDRCNFYGIPRAVAKNSPRWAAAFKKRIKGTTGYAWTDDISNVEAYVLEACRRHADRLDKSWSDSGNAEGRYNVCYCTSIDGAKRAADEMRSHLKNAIDRMYYGMQKEEIQKYIGVLKGDIARWEKLLAEQTDALASKQEQIDRIPTCA